MKSGNFPECRNGTLIRYLPKSFVRRACQLCDLCFYVGKGEIELFAATWFGALLQIGLNARARQQQDLHFSILCSFRSVQMGVHLRTITRAKIIHLILDRLAFPSSGHDPFYARRAERKD